MKVELDVDEESLDKVVRQSLFDQYQCLVNSSPNNWLSPTKAKKELAEQKEIAKHLKAVIEYYGGSVE